jgi:hypothetical protein
LAIKANWRHQNRKKQHRNHACVIFLILQINNFKLNLWKLNSHIWPFLKGVIDLVHVCKCKSWEIRSIFLKKKKNERMCVDILFFVSKITFRHDTYHQISSNYILWRIIGKAENKAEMTNSCILQPFQKWGWGLALEINYYTCR